MNREHEQEDGERRRQGDDQAHVRLLVFMGTRLDPKHQGTVSAF